MIALRMLSSLAAKAAVTAPSLVHVSRCYRVFVQRTTTTASSLNPFVLVHRRCLCSHQSHCFSSRRSVSHNMAASFKKLQVFKPSPDFGSAVQVVETPLTPPKAGQVLIRNHYAGVNATDVNVSAGRYFTDGKVPYDIGFEALGVVEEVAADVTNVKKGQAVLLWSGSGFSEVVYAEADKVFPLPDVKPEYLVTLVNGLTAAIGLDEAGRIKAGDKVLVTAAAGGTGQVAVQWAKLKGCHVIGTTSSDEKGEFLKSIGVDHVINYKKENLSDALKAKYPDGVDVIWETIGGETLKTLFNHLGVKGRLVVIGGITGYKGDGFPDVVIEQMPARVLMSSISISGFFLPHYEKQYVEYWKKLFGAIAEGKIKVKVDEGEKTAGGKFYGVSDVARAVDHLHSGKNEGKVVVKIQ